MIPSLSILIFWQFIFQGIPEKETLILAPWTDPSDGVSKEVTYFRALITLHVTNSQKCFVKFVDYGNYKLVNFQDLKPLPKEPVPGIGKCIENIKFLAVRYQLKGVSLKHQYSIPDRYPFHLYYGKNYWVDIYSTYSGDLVKEWLLIFIQLIFMACSFLLIFFKCR